MNKFLIIGVLTVSFRGIAQDYSPKRIASSPFNWSVSIDNKKFNGTQINELLKNGADVNDGKTKCTFEFYAEWDKKSAHAIKHGAIYHEMLSVECKIGDVLITPHSVVCLNFNNSDEAHDNLTIGIGSSKLSIDCSRYKNK